MGGLWKKYCNCFYDMTSLIILKSQYKKLWAVNKMGGCLIKKVIITTFSYSSFYQRLHGSSFLIQDVFLTILKTLFLFHPAIGYQFPRLCIYWYGPSQNQIDLSV